MLKYKVKINSHMVGFFFLNLVHLQRPKSQQESRLQDKVTLLGCLSQRNWPSRTKQFRILLSFKLEHIEGLLSDW